MDVECDVSVYKILCFKSNLVYIGCSKNPYERFNQHLNSACSVRNYYKPLSIDVRKYGKEQFKLEILSVHKDRKIASDEERKITKSLKLVNLYNSIHGGGSSDNEDVNYINLISVWNSEGIPGLVKISFSGHATGYTVLYDLIKYRGFGSIDLLTKLKEEHKVEFPRNRYLKDDRDSDYEVLYLEWKTNGIKYLVKNNHKNSNYDKYGRLLTLMKNYNYGTKRSIKTLVGERYVLSCEEKSIKTKNRYKLNRIADFELLYGIWDIEGIEVLLKYKYKDTAIGQGYCRLTKLMKNYGYGSISDLNRLKYEYSNRNI